MVELTKKYFDRKFEEMAQMVAKGFKQTSKDIDRLEARIIKLEEEIKALSAKLTNYMELSDKRYLELKRRDLVIAKWLKQIADKTGINIDLAEREKF